MKMRKLLTGVVAAAMAVSTIASVGAFDQFDTSGAPTYTYEAPKSYEIKTLHVTESFNLSPYRAWFEDSNQIGGTSVQRLGKTGSTATTGSEANTKIADNRVSSIFFKSLDVDNGYFYEITDEYGEKVQKAIDKTNMRVKNFKVNDYTVTKGGVAPTVAKMYAGDGNVTEDKEKVAYIDADGVGVNGSSASTQIGATILHAGLQQTGYETPALIDSVTGNIRVSETVYKDGLFTFNTGIRNTFTLSYDIELIAPIRVDTPILRTYRNSSSKIGLVDFTEVNNTATVLKVDTKPGAGNWSDAVSRTVDATAPQARNIKEVLVSNPITDTIVKADTTDRYAGTGTKDDVDFTKVVRDSYTSFKIAEKESMLKNGAAFVFNLSTPAKSESFVNIYTNLSQKNAAAKKMGVWFDKGSTQATLIVPPEYVSWELGSEYAHELLAFDSISAGIGNTGVDIKSIDLYIKPLAVEDDVDDVQGNPGEGEDADLAEDEEEIVEETEEEIIEETEEEIVEETDAPTDDKNQPTGVALAIVPVLVAGVAAIVAKKRK